jgi:8-oxo-dGTP diphosphatase
MKRGPHKRVFPNRYNGLGGHIERDESPSEGVRREIREESGLEVVHLALRGLVNIDAGAATGIMLFVYTAQALSRDFVASDEGALEWVPLESAAQKDLVDDLPLLLPRLFGKGASPSPFAAQVHYDEQDRMVFTFSD